MRKLFQNIIDNDNRNLILGGIKGASTIANSIYDWIFDNPYPATFKNRIKCGGVGYSDKNVTVVKVGKHYYKIFVKEVGLNEIRGYL